MVKQQKLPHDGGGGSGGVHVPISGKLSKRARRKRLPYAQVLRMLSQEQSESEADGSSSGVGGGGGLKDDGAVAGASGAVTPSGFVNGEGTEEFLSTGRTGRRNAMPDILGQHAETGTADLPERLEALTTDPGGSSSSTMGQPGPSTSQAQHQPQQQQSQQHAG